MTDAGNRKIVKFFWCSLCVTPNLNYKFPIFKNMIINCKNKNNEVEWNIINFLILVNKINTIQKKSGLRYKCNQIIKKYG